MTALDGHALSVRAIADALINAFDAGLPVKIEAEHWKRPVLAAVVDAVMQTSGRTGAWGFTDPEVALDLFGALAALYAWESEQDATAVPAAGEWSCPEVPSALADGDGELEQDDAADDSEHVAVESAPATEAISSDDSGSAWNFYDTPDIAATNTVDVTDPTEVVEVGEEVEPLDADSPEVEQLNSELAQWITDDLASRQDTDDLLTDAEPSADLVVRDDELPDWPTDVIPPVEPLAPVVHQDARTQVIALSVSELSVGALNVKEMHVSNPDGGPTTIHLKVEDVLPAIGQPERDRVAIPADPLGAAAYAFIALQQPVMVQNLKPQPLHVNVPMLRSASGTTAQDMFREIALLDQFDA